MMLYYIPTSNKLGTIICINKLHQIIDTRVTPQSATLLDIIVTNKHDAIIHKDIIPNTIADRDLITATVKITKPKRKPGMRTFRHLGAHSKDLSCDGLIGAAPALKEISSTDNVDIQVHSLTSVLSNCLEQCAPFVTKEINEPFDSWINDEIRSAMSTRNTLQARLRQNRNNAELLEQYKHQRNRVKSLLRYAEQSYCREKYTTVEPIQRPHGK